jgi:hypothetical protein
MKKKKLKKQLKVFSAYAGDLRQELELAQNEMGSLRASHAKLCRGIREAMGIENWPSINGLFAEGVVSLLRNWAVDLKEKANGKQDSDSACQSVVREEVGDPGGSPR